MYERIIHGVVPVDDVFDEKNKDEKKYVTLYERYLHLLLFLEKEMKDYLTVDDNKSVKDIRTIITSPDVEIASPFSYNFIITNKIMCVVPRIYQDFFFDRPSPFSPFEKTSASLSQPVPASDGPSSIPAASGGTSAGRKVSVNSLGFAGFLFTEEESTLEKMKSYGLQNLLLSVGYPVKKG
jgi:hypothetical protein